MSFNFEVAFWIGSTSRLPLGRNQSSECIKLIAAAPGQHAGFDFARCLSVWLSLSFVRQVRWGSISKAQQAGAQLGYRRQVFVQSRLGNLYDNHHQDRILPGSPLSWFQSIPLLRPMRPQVTPAAKASKLRSLASCGAQGSRASATPLRLLLPAAHARACVRVHARV